MTTHASLFDPITDIIAAIQAGQMVVILDD